MSINYQFFRDKLYNYTNRVFDLVATIDHPYASPPIRLIDGHYKLNALAKKGLKPYICIWDVNNPNVSSYRYELTIDTGIFNARDKDFFIFDDKVLYPLQKPRLIDFVEIEKRVRLILLRLGVSDVENFLDNLKIIINIYRRNIENSTNGTRFYQNLLSDLYTTLQFEDLAEFINNFSESYFFSSIITEWIPFCIQKTQGEVFGISALLKKGLFQKPCFRPITDSKKIITDISNAENNLDWVLSALRSRLLIPSYEVFFWTLALADIKHFGNDYGFFDRLNQIFPFFSNQIQLTQHNQDSSYIIQFEKDRSFNCFREKDRYIFKKNNPMKISRISSIPAIFCHAGIPLRDILWNIFKGIIQSPKIIKMGEIYKYEHKNVQ